MTTRVDVRVGRVYDEPASRDGYRVLVDRIWPRGLRKDRANIDQWCKQAAPTTELRRWYGHDPDRFSEFKRRYEAELRDAEHAEALAELARLARQGTLTLLTASKDIDISHAHVLAAAVTSAAVARRH